MGEVEAAASDATLNLPNFLYFSGEDEGDEWLLELPLLLLLVESGDDSPKDAGEEGEEYDLSMLGSISLRVRRATAKLTNDCMRCSGLSILVQTDDDAFICLLLL